MNDTMKWYFKVVRDYKNFQGRASREEYWTYQLINIVIFIILIPLFSLFAFIIGDFFNSTSSFQGGTNENSNLIQTVIIYISVFIAVGITGRFYIIPNYAVMARRLHDIGCHSLYMLLVLIPLISGMIFFYLQWKLKEDSELSQILLILMFIMLILYFIGRTIIFVLTLLDSKPTTNKWGPCPKPPMNYTATTNLRSRPTNSIRNSH